MTGIIIFSTHDFDKRKSGIDQILFDDISDSRAATDSQLVTVFISAYNAQDTIADAINSILNQTHKNTQLIVDDASQDKTYDICLEFKEKFHNIELVRNTISKGTYYNRNMGLEKASGAFFTILDADDILIHVDLKYNCPQ